jgi:hypothetical protein
VPVLFDLSILYPVIGEPPLFPAVQLRLICEDDIAVAVNPVGGDGGILKVVADAVLDGPLVPIAFIANTRYV